MAFLSSRGFALKLGVIGESCRAGQETPMLWPEEPRKETLWARESRELRPERGTPSF